MPELLLPPSEKLLRPTRLGATAPAFKRKLPRASANVPLRKVVGKTAQACALIAALFAGLALLFSGLTPAVFAGLVLLLAALSPIIVAVIAIVVTNGLPQPDKKDRSVWHPQI